MVRTWRRWLLILGASLAMIGTARAWQNGGTSPGNSGAGPAASPIESTPPEEADEGFARPLNPSGRYRPGIPSPEEFLGYPLGARFTPHHRIVDYGQALAAAGTGRVAWEPYGQSVEGRPLGLLVIASPENRRRLDSIRRDLAALAEPESLSDRAAGEIARRSPLVVWLSFNVHGDEASSSETAMALAYELTAGDGPEVAALLDSLVILVDPCLNPDGRDRYVGGFEQRLGRRPQPDGASWEHQEPWPGGRYNHYLFDLNRDWAWLTQDETRARAQVFRSWRPQVHVDFHEMRAGSTYFFFPAAEPINTNLPPQVRHWADLFGRGNAEAFDEQGWPYFTAEQFDLYYPGYGDSWPTLQGATGMTYEQAGHGGAGLLLRRADGRLLSLRERIRRHFTAGMATLRTARRERERRLLDYRRFFEDGLEGRTGGPAAYLLPPGSDPNRSAELVDLLRRHGVRVERATGKLDVSDPRDYDGEPVRHDFPAGTWVVPGRQSMAALVHSLLEPEASLPETLFYDVSAWSLPLAFGVEAAWTDKEPSGPRVAVSAATYDSGGVEGGPARVGWLLPWETNAAPRLLHHLLRRGARARFATRDFELDGRPFERGTIFIPRDGNPDTLGAAIERLARHYRVRVTAARSALTGTGIDLGSDRFLPVRPPRVAVLAGDGVDPSSLGALWFLLDRSYEIPATFLTAASLARANLADYNVLVFPDDESGDGSSYESAIDSVTVGRIRRWMEAGGTFVGLKGGAAWATRDHAGLSALALKPADDDSAAGDDTGADDVDEELRRKLATREEREKEGRLDSIPGTILRVELDTSHPLAYGYGGEARILKTSRLLFEPSEKGQNVAWYPPMARVSGFISVDNEERLAHTPFLVVESTGQGHAVLYNDDPNFRVFWFGLNRLFLNSLFFTAGL